MDQYVLVDQRIDDGMKLVARLIKDGFDVTVAAWVQTREEGLWFLYIGSNSVDMTRNLGESYQRLYASLSKLGESVISLSEVKLINSANPIAQAALKYRDQLPGRPQVRSRAQLLGGLAVEEIYIYPLIGPMTPAEVIQTVVGLMSRSGQVQPSQVTLHDGSTLRGIPRGIRSAGSVVEVDLLDQAGASHSIPLDQIATIQ